MQTKKCTYCVYAEVETDGLVKCRRGLPNKFGDWPYVNGNDWCGEYRRIQEHL